MDIPWQSLKAETLCAVIKEFVTRDGTDYGQSEASFDTKITDVYRLLKDKKARVVFDVESETCDIREVKGE